MKLVAPKEFKDSLPIRRVGEVAKIWAHITLQYSERGRFSNTVLPYKTEDLTWAWSWKSVQLKSIVAVPVCGFAFKTFRQIYDRNRLKGTPLDALSTANTECLRDEADRVRRLNLNTKLSRHIDGTLLAALLLALFRLAFVWVDDCNSYFIVRSVNHDFRLYPERY